MPILFSNSRIAPSMDSGTGGMPFHHHAPHSPFALVGLLVRAGAWIDQVTPIYAELLDDGHLGPDFYGPSFGGPGGTPQELRVEPGHVVTGMQTRSGNFIDGIRLLETRWNGQLSDGESRWTRWVLGHSVGGVERPERIAEPFGRALVMGIAGRSGKYLDNLTFVSAEPQRVAASGTQIGTAGGRGKQPAVGG